MYKTTVHDTTISLKAFGNKMYSNNIFQFRDDWPIFISIRGSKGVKRQKTVRKTNILFLNPDEIENE